MAEFVEPSIAELARKEVEDCRRFFELGDTSRIHHALRWCIVGALPIPDWLAPDVEAATEFYFRKGGANGKGKGGGNAVRYQRQRKDRYRHQVALHELARRDTVGGNRDDAFERASVRLRGTFAQGSADAIEKSHDRIQKKLKAFSKTTPTNSG